MLSTASVSLVNNSCFCSVRKAPSTSFTLMIGITYSLLLRTALAVCRRKGRSGFACCLGQFLRFAEMLLDRREQLLCVAFDLRIPAALRFAPECRGSLLMVLNFMPQEDAVEGGPLEFGELLDGRILTDIDAFGNGLARFAGKFRQFFVGLGVILCQRLAEVLHVGGGAFGLRHLAQMRFSHVRLGRHDHELFVGAAKP